MHSFRFGRGALVAATLATLVVFAFALLPVAATADDTAVASDAPLWQRNVSTAWEQAVAQQRPLLMYFSTASCPHCRKMRVTYANPKVAALVRESTVAVAVDGKRERNLVRRFSVKAFPTTLVIAPDGREVGVFEGYAAPEVFGRDLAEAVNLATEPARVAARPTRLR